MTSRTTIVLVILYTTGCSGVDSKSQPGDTNSPDTMAEVLVADQFETRDNLEVQVVDVLDISDDTGKTSLNPPNEPPLPDGFSPVSGRNYEQEFNHTWNEPENDVGELVALVVPPDTHTGLLRPTLISPRGLLISGDEGALKTLQIPGEDPDLITADSGSTSIFLMSPTHIYRVTPEFTVQVIEEAPAGITLRTLSTTKAGFVVGTSKGFGIFNAGAGDGGLIFWDESPAESCAAGQQSDTLLVACSNQLHAYDVSSENDTAPKLWAVPLDVGEPIAVLFNRTLPRSLDTVIAGTTGLAGFTLTEDGAQAVAVPLFQAGQRPLTALVAAAPDANGGIIAAAPGGVFRITDDSDLIGPEYRVYAAERWIPSSDVRDVLALDDQLFFATASGLGRVDRKEWTLPEKMAHFTDIIVQRHDRDGAVSDSHLTTPGDLSTSIPWDSDNDGGWTCYWILAECFRYKVTGDPEAKAHFDKSLERMLSLRTLTGTEYFLARSVIRIDGCQLDDCDGPDDGEWFLSPDAKWWVKGDTSNDEVDSHMFMMGTAYDLCADEEQRAAIRAHVDGIIGGIIDHEYKLIDPQDGEVTSHGNFDPLYVNWWVEGLLGDGGIRSTEIIGAINLAWHVTGKEKYLVAKEELLVEHDYGANIANMGNPEVFPFCAGSGDCDELGMQAFVTLLRYEWDPQLYATWLGAWNQHYDHLRLQEDSFWDLINGMLGGNNLDLQHTVRFFERYPVDMIRFIMHNQARKDSIPAPDYYLIKDSKAGYVVRSDNHIFPADERPNIRHNTPQYPFNGGWGAGMELDPADILYAWWLGRYYGLIEP